jgi:putative oxidoreductase
MQKGNRYRDTGIMLLRLGFGIMFVFHGMPILMAGAEKWADIGGSMNQFGIHFWPAFWGFMSAFTDFAGGILLIMGLFTRTVSVFMFLNMAVAVSVHLKDPDFMKSGSHATEDAIVFLSLIFIGAGRFSLDGMLGKK